MPQKLRAGCEPVRSWLTELRKTAMKRGSWVGVWTDRRNGKSAMAPALGLQVGFGGTGVGVAAFSPIRRSAARRDDPLAHSLLLVGKLPSVFLIFTPPLV